MEIRDSVMSMIPEHDYVVINSWKCPVCGHIYTLEHTRIGRSPFMSKLHCYKGCGEETPPLLAINVVYLDQPTPTKQEKK